MNTLLTKFRLWRARRQLQSAIIYEADCRASSTYMLREVIPALEKRVRRLEIDVLLEGRNAPTP